MASQHAAEARRQEQAAQARAAERAQLLTEAAGSWELAGEPEQARRCYLAALADGGQVVGDVRAYYARFLAEQGESAAAEQLYAELWAGRPTEPEVYHLIGSDLGKAGDHEGALRWLTAGISRELGGRELRVADLDDVALRMLVAARANVRLSAGLPPDEWDTRTAASPTPVAPSVPEQPMCVAYWPEQEFLAAVARWPGAFPAVVRRVGTHLAHRHVVEQTLRLKPADRAAAVVRLSVAGYAEYVRAFRAEPDEVATTQQFAHFSADVDRMVRWPPERNGPCWCGSGVKYKKCCGHPAFGES